MKICPNCKAELDNDSRFCLLCMTALEDKEHQQPPVHKKPRWLFVLLFCVVLTISLLVVLIISNPPVAPHDPGAGSGFENRETTGKIEQQEPSIENTSVIRQVVDGVIFTFRPATIEDHPTAIRLDNYYVLIQVEGTPSTGVYCVPSFIGNDTTALVVAVADGAFSGTQATIIDLGYNVRYVWGNAFGGYSLTDLHLHEDTYIDRSAFSGCSADLTIHCPSYIENTEGDLWSELAGSYGFLWQDTLY